jgi:hypothetical protein
VSKLLWRWKKELGITNLGLGKRKLLLTRALKRADTGPILSKMSKSHSKEGITSKPKPRACKVSTTRI